MAGRPRTFDDRELFVNTIEDAENDQTFDTQSALFKLIAELLEIPVHTVANRVREWNVVLKTKPGKRGRPAGSVNTINRVVKEREASPEDGPDLSELLAAFAPLKPKCTRDMIASADKTREQNVAIKQAWSTLREMLDCPRFSIQPAVESNPPTVAAAIEHVNFLIGQPG